MIKQISWPHTGHLVIRASAGTGKTFQLSNRFLRLLYENKPADQILAVTFTRKAAGEILDRVLLRLAQAADDDQARYELAGHLGTDLLPRERVLFMLREATRNLHRLRISTLDSFFAQIAGTFALELGFPPGWRIVDVFTDQRLRLEAIDSVLQRHSSRDLSTLMNLLSKGEVARSVRDVLRDTVADLYSTFQETSEDAWKQIPRPARLSKAQIAEAAGTLRGFSVENHARLESALNTDCDLVESGDWETFIQKGVGSKIAQGETTYYRKPIPAEVVDLYRPLIEHARAELVGLVAFQTEASYDLLKHFDEEYQRLKQERRALRFDDITVRLARLASAGADRLTWRLDSGVSHLLLDEFQDTSVLQWRVIFPFAKRITSATGGESFFCVGDVKQAIYGWRGGKAELFNSLDKDLSGLMEQPLDESRRCSQPVIDTVNRVFAEMPRHNNLDRLAPAVQKWSKAFRPHTTFRRQTPGYVRWETSRSPNVEDNTLQPVLETAAERVGQLARQTAGMSIGVLVRTNQAVTRMIHLLRKADVSASEEGGNPLVDSAAVELILSLLRLADHPGDGPARFHVANSPLGKWWCFENHTSDQAAHTLAREIRGALLHQGYGDVINSWAEKLASHGWPRDQRRLSQLVELAYRHQAETTLRAEDFVELVETTHVADPAAADVRVMTIHQAKGLEFDIVVLPQLDYKLRGQNPQLVTARRSPTQPIERVTRYCNEGIQSLMPEKFQKMFEEAIQNEVTEALCLLYVSLTRPIHALHMITPPLRQKKIPKTAAGLLRASLIDGKAAEPNSVVYECGDPKWWEKISQPVSPAASPPAQHHFGPALQGESLGKIKLAPSRGRRQRHLERKSPSSLEGGSQVDLADVFTRERGSIGMEWGTVIHAWFEKIRWLEDGPPDEEQLRSIAMQTASPSLDIDQMLMRFEEMLANPQIRGALLREAYKDLSRWEFSAAMLQRLQKESLRLTVKNECPFAIRDKDDLVNGYIDRLVLLHDGSKRIAAEILDYKTDAVDAADKQAMSAKVEYYRPQIEAYRRAVVAMTGLATKRTKARLLFVAAGVVRDV